MLTSAQIVAQALGIAKVPGFTTQANAAFISILSEICETYDFEASKVAFFGNFQPGVVSTNPNQVQGGGPYNLPATFLRMLKEDFVWWLNGVPYPLVPIDEAEFDIQVQQVGIASLPRLYQTDVSNPAQPVFFVYPPPNGAYAYQGKCQVRMPDIGSGTVAATGWASGNQTPDLSAVVPWFPNSTYLITRLAGEVMKVTGDRRMQDFLGEGPEGAQGILKRILPMKDNKTNRAQRITFDKRRFGPRYSTLPDTKNVFG